MTIPAHNPRVIETIARFETASRYYAVLGGCDLLGQHTLIRVWGGKGSRRGGVRVEIFSDADAVTHRAEVIARRRRQRGYVLRVNA